jgi:hypothetical protein
MRESEGDSTSRLALANRPALALTSDLVSWVQVVAACGAKETLPNWDGLGLRMINYTLGVYPPYRLGRSRQS